MTAPDRRHQIEQAAEVSDRRTAAEIMDELNATDHIQDSEKYINLRALWQEVDREEREKGRTK